MDNRVGELLGGLNARLMLREEVFKTPWIQVESEMSEEVFGDGICL